MWINRVELDNIKSYGQKTTIELAPGVNAICGQNGAGKTTIVEAIGLALFGQSSYKNQDQLVNLQAKRGEIAITVVDSRDDRAYQVVRPLKGGSPYVYDPETKRQLASGVGDVQRWLRDCMGVEPTTDLQALFENAIGVPQGLLTTAFLLTEANRRKVFDPLLGVEEYKRVWDSMLAVVNTIKDQRSQNDKAQERRLGKLEALPGLRAEAQSLQQTISDAVSEYRQTTDKLTELTEQLILLKKQEANIQSLEGQLQALNERREDLEAQLQVVELALAQARHAQEQVEQSEADYHAYEQALQERQDLEDERSVRDEIKKRLDECEQALALIEQAVAEFQRQWAQVTQAEAEVTTLTPLVEQQAALEHTHRSLDTAVADLKTAQERADDEARRLGELQAELAGARQQVDQRDKAGQEIKAHQLRTDALAAELTALDQGLGDLEDRLESVRQALQVAQGRLNKYETLQGQMAKTQEALTERRSRLSEMVTELAQRSELEQALEAVSTVRQRRKAELASLEDQINAQDSVREQTQATLNDWQSQAQTLTNLQGNLATAQARLAEAETELAKLKEAFERRNKLAEQIQAWETEQGRQNEQRDDLKDQISRHETRLAALTETLAAIAVEAETPCPVCQKPLSEHDLASLKTHYEAEHKNIQAELDAAQAQLSQTNKSLKKLGQQIKRARQEQEPLATEAHLVKQQALISTSLSDATSLHKQVAGLRPAPEQVKYFRTQLDQVQDRLTGLKTQRAELRQADETDEKKQAKLQGELSPLARQVDLERLEGDIEQLQVDLTRLNQELQELSDAPAQVKDLETDSGALAEQKAQQQRRRQQVTNERDDLTQEIGRLQTKMSHLAAPGRVADLEAELERQDQILLEWQEKVTVLAPAPAELAAVAKALADLDDPRGRQRVALSEASKRPQLEAEQAKKQAELEAKQQEKGETVAQLEPFGDLDQALRQVNTTLEKTRDAHHLYLEQRATAKTLSQRESHAKQAKQKVAQVVQTQEDAQARLSEARGLYDCVLHQSVQQQEAATRTRQTQLETQLQEHRKQLAELEEKIAVLETVAAELANLKQSGEQLADLQTVVEFIRRTIREAGPEVTKRLVKVISLNAAAIFADIMNDHRQELNWDESYAVTVRRDGYERDFQQLSGGEAMTAALAVRLALLQSMSTVDVAFFDEPTANLDPERRASLAERIAQIKGISQLVVISHDDTFEQDIGHVIHIAKDEQGCSQVVA